MAELEWMLLPLPTGAAWVRWARGRQSLLEKRAPAAHQTPNSLTPVPPLGSPGAHKCSHQTMFMMPVAAVRPGVPWPLCGSGKPALRRMWGRFNPFWDLSMGKETPGAHSSRSFKFTPYGPPFLSSLRAPAPHQGLPRVL